ncbi:helix-turn-helix domain-containing protein [Hymenobacter sp. GOD-10R]|uniref:TetR/AcrR family transcriptional regulator n=1 Tax=Hymenobacter sp. GOD-10R TaxID=3093922 RepID=UPI002D7791B3|nr:helix-turn-helix domain-containing protein [Hymenobacter sp. GOD-10R]WRQ29750.1 helix-turn-helix domain-containing protein [Hymenobacter sp. GOD-10R]
MEASKPSTEELILNAAQAVFLEKGIAGARMQEIADRASINKALLHYYFRSKEKLASLVINKTVGLLVPRMLAILEADLDLFAKIRQFASEYVTFISQHRFLPLFIINEVNRSPQFFFTATLGHQQAGFVLFQQQVDAAIAAGRIRPISANQLLINMMSMLIFPFLGEPVFRAVLALSAAEFEAEMERRHTEVADFIIRAIEA